MPEHRGHTTSVRRLAAIMFTDIVGYTKLMGSDEEKALEILKINREIHTHQLEKFNGILIKEMGDGILSSFDSTIKAVQCAIAIQEESRWENIALRIGIHEGEIVFQGDDVFGDGVNIASRLQEIAEEGYIYFSGAVYNNVKNKKGISVEFIGEKKLKNVDDPVMIYKIINQVADIRKDNTGKVDLVNRIAILPFKNLSEIKENQFFCDGIMDSIINHFSKIKEIKVISRLSVEQYRDYDKNTKQIAKELYANYILNGSVQRYGENIRIIIQLVDAESDENLWSENFDEKLTINNIFNIQSEVAKQVVKILEINLTSNVVSQIEKMITNNISAYDHYTKGRSLYLKMNIKDNEKAIDHFNMAVDLDTKFSIAYAGLADSYNYKSYYEANINLLDLALIFGEKALANDPDLAEAYSSLGWSKYWIELASFRKSIDLNIEVKKPGSYSRSIDLLNKAIDLNPNHALSYERLGEIYFNLKLFDKAYVNIRKAYELEPTKNYHCRKLGYLFLWLDDFKTSKYFFLKENKLSQFSSYGIYLLHLFEKNYKEAKDYCERLYENNPDNPDIIGALSAMYVHQKEYKKAEDLLRLCIKMGLEDKISSEQHRLAYVLWEMGNKDEAKVLFDKKMDMLRREGFRYGKFYDMAAINAFLGNREEAFNLLSFAFKYDWFYSYRYTLFDPLFDSIKGENMFLDIINQEKNKIEKYRKKLQKLEITDLVFTDLN